MGKVLLLLGLALVIWWMWRKMSRPAAPGSAKRPLPPVESMVACAHCGVNQPASECIESDGRYYCSDAHRRLAEGDGQRS
jgi:uncharacterized protein